jgi:D-arginine dehydrogenase
MSDVFDVIVIGGGMAGAAAAAHLAPKVRTLVLEAEEVAGYHSTGRSAAIWILNYGPEEVRLLTAASRPFFLDPGPGFADHPLITPRPVLTLVPPGQEADFETFLATGQEVREISLDEARQLVPALRPGYARAAAIEDAFDMDVAAIHQGFLRRVRSHGGTVALDARVAGLRRSGGVWEVRSVGGAIARAARVVNAAGAWGDEVARLAGLPPLGLTPKRRTGVIIDPSPHQVADWPMVQDVVQSWYCRPEARTRLMVSPADATPMPPSDVQPDELDIAIGIDRMQQALDIEVRRIERAWAGLRTFTPDGHLAIGAEPGAEGFFWCVGQGGYGIQTAPAAGALTAALVLGEAPDAALLPALPFLDPARFRRAPAAA